MKPLLPRLVAVAVLATIPRPVAARTACLAYEPANVVLTGRLTTQRGAGVRAPPNLLLELDRPVCLQAGSGAPGETEVAVVELVFLRGAGLASGLAGRRVAVSGALFHRDRGADAPTRIAMTVAGIGRSR